jgi:hypothetical protein
VIGVVWIALGLFVGVVASIPLRLSVHHFRSREWEAAVGNLVLGVMLFGISLAQFAYAVARFRAA